VATIDGGRRQGNLSSAIRLFVLEYYRSQSGADRDRSEAAGNVVPQPPASVVGSE
jgi:predicted DNA-binding ribbon-helix-helix protein